KKEAQKRVAVGDPAVLAYSYEKLNKDLAISKAFDNRAGAFVVLEAARQLSLLDPKAEIHAVATVQEEIGLRGARTAAHGINPDIGIAVDVTFATDHPSMGDAAKSWNNCKLGGGPVITRGPNINPKLFDLLVKTAEEEKIPYQVNAEGRGTGTDANALQTSGDGVAAALISVPNRYMHSPVEMCSLSDLENCARLMAQTVARIKSADQFIPF
ncbi:MAG: putative aminopeptidase FrvX, partial [Verrucomicrobiales bacterium]